MKALEGRFKERQATTAYLAQLEGRRMQPKENISEFIADIRKLVIKSYPTADEQTRETIALRHFLKGLPDEQGVVAVGMSNPKTVDAARTAYETYNSLKNDLGRPSRARVAQVPGDTAAPEKSPPVQWVTKQELQKFEDGIKASFDAKFDKIEALIKESKPKSAQNGSKKRRQVDKKDIECYQYHEKGHYARECPAESVMDTKPQEN